MEQEIIVLSLFLFFYTIFFNIRNKICHFLGLMDMPNDKRKIHLKPTPLFGGLVILLTIILNIKNLYNFLPNKEFLILIFLISIYFILSLLDDIKNLNSYFRLSFLFLTTYILLSYSDIFVLKKLIFSFNQIQINLGIFDVFISTLCILLLVNALNLSDGINGLSTLLILSWFIYIKLILFNNFTLFNISTIVILLIIFYHIYKGLYFMGDYGITVSALIIGLISISSYNLQNNNSVEIFVEELFLLFFIPGLDMLRLFIERITKKKDPFSPDKNHLHHLLISRYELKKTLLIYFAISIIPILLYKFTNLNTLLLIVFYSLIYILFLIKMTKKYF
jgi:UDP-GlcNAc:undecaprenyl-phosphate GlcNAc-1-phosphate transferase